MKSNTLIDDAWLYKNYNEWFYAQKEMKSKEHHKINPMHYLFNKYFVPPIVPPIIQILEIMDDGRHNRRPIFFAADHAANHP